MHQRLRHIIILLSILQGACGLFFLVEEEESKCFIQTTPGDTMVLVKFAVEEHDQQSAGFKQSPAGRLIHLEVRDEDGLVFLSRDYGSEGHITFTAIREGDNKICFRSNRLRFWESDIQLRVHLDIKLGHNVLDNKRDMKQLDLDYMQLRVLKLQHQAEQIKKESNFQRYQEQVFRDTSQSIYYHLLFWSYFQLFILVIIFMIQSSYLRKKSYLYGGLRKVIHEPELAMFRTSEAFNALIDIIGTKGNGVNGKAMSQWMAKVPDPESLLEKVVESEKLLLTEKLLAKVEEFADKFLRKQKPATPETPKSNFYASNASLATQLVASKRDPSAHLKGDSFLLVCECNECLEKQPILTNDGTDTEAKTI